LRRNVEIKARARDFPDQLAAARELSNGREEVLVQEDVFFAAPSGRLKLRKFAGGPAELIYYERPDTELASESSYVVVPTDDAEAAGEFLSRLFGVVGVVKKTRTLCLVGSTRIHLDRVEGLGEFVEIEAVLEPAESFRDGRARLEEIRSALGIDDSDLVDVAYVDMLAASDRDPGDGSGVPE
jgi:predicted adenylyl cyclase CyaB